MNQIPGSKELSMPAAGTESSASAPRAVHLTALDGWRGTSILLVLAAHLLPLGPKGWQLNETAARLGMALFFTLSGFLITRLLLADTTIKDFLIRRLLRIVPLAWLAMAIAFPLTDASGSVYLPNFFFYANLPPIRLAETGSHLWSLCVEMQFYLAVAVIVLLCGKRGLFALPLLCICVTLLRVTDGAYVDIVTWRRADEILAGVTVALIYNRRLGTALIRGLSGCNVFVLLLLAVIASHPSTGFMNYLRPYVAAALIGCTLYAPPANVGAILSSRILKYIATISFALYVLHGMLVGTWLGSGSTLVKYAKRPLLIALTFLMAHLSTFYFESYWIGLGKRLTKGQGEHGR